MAKNTRVVNSAHARTLRKSFRINPVAKAQALSRRRAGAYRDRKKYDRKRDKKDAEKDHHLSQASKGKIYLD
jgi:hypothetical protein